MGKIISKEFEKEIRSKNNPEKSEIIIDFMEFVSKELKDFEFHPKKIELESDVYDKAFDEAINSLKKVNFRPFGLVGVTGSVVLRKNKDIDFFVFPKREISGGLLLAAVNEFSKKLKENYEKRFNKRVIIFSFSLHQEESEYFSKRKDDELLIHLSSICGGFYGKHIGNENGLKAWFPKYVLFKEGVIPTDIKINKLDDLVKRLDILNLFEAGYPEELLRRKNHQFIYIVKYLGVKFDNDFLEYTGGLYQGLSIILGYLNK